MRCQRFAGQTVVAALILVAAAGCSRTPADAPQSVVASANSPKTFTRKIESVFADQTKTLECDFPLRNETDHDIRFLKVNHTCSCTKAELSRMELSPGDEATLHVVANLGQRKGPQQFNSQVVVEGEELPWVCLLETTIYQRAAFEPGELHLGFLKPNQISHFQALLETYTPPKEKPPSADVAISIGANVKITLGQADEQTLLDGVTRRTVPVEIEVTPQAEMVTNRTTVEAKMVGEAGTITATMPITWSVTPIYDLAPARVFFGDVTDKSEPIQVRVILRLPDGKVVTIRQITSSSPAVKASVLPNGPASVHTFQIVLDPKQINESLDGAVTAITDDDAQTKVRIPFAAFLKR